MTELTMTTVANEFKSASMEVLRYPSGTVKQNICKFCGKPTSTHCTLCNKSLCWFGRRVKDDDGGFKRDEGMCFLNWPNLDDFGLASDDCSLRGLRKTELLPPTIEDEAKFGKYVRYCNEQRNDNSSNSATRFEGLANGLLMGIISSTTTTTTTTTNSNTKQAPNYDKKTKKQ